MVEKKKVIKTAEEFVERVKNKHSVSRLEFDLGFKWNKKTSIVLNGADLNKADLRGADLIGANLNEADLSWADLIGADLRGAKGEFYFNFGVKLKVV